jgi:heat shock protein HslJ
MSDNNQPNQEKRGTSRKTRNILIVVIVILAVIMLAVLIPLTFCSRQDLEDESPPPATEESVDEGEEAIIVKKEGIVDRITDKYLELVVDGAVILIYLDGYRLPEDLAAGDKVYVEYKVDKIAEQNILITLKILDKAEQPGEPKITDISWQWERFTSGDGSEIIVADPNQYTIIFREDGSVEIKADCNNALGTYKTKDSSLKIALGPTTLAECGEGSLYNQYLINLENVATYVLDGGKLYLNLKADAGDMIFRSVEVTHY